MTELLTIGEVSKRSGVASSALRFYEDRGLIASERAGSGHRRYDRSVLRRIGRCADRLAQRRGGECFGNHDELDLASRVRTFARKQML